MGKFKFALIIFGVTLIILLAVFYLVGYFKPKSAGLIIETNPTSSVYIDDQQVGRSPFEVTRAQGDIALKLIPDSFDKPLTPFETKVKLVSGVKTVIRRNFGESDETSSGVIISFEKVGGDETSIAVISTPDAASVKIDGVTRDFTPYKSSSISEGDHTLGLSADGYKEESIEVKTYKGYKLTAEFKLAVSDMPSSPTPTPEPEKPTERVEILDTPNGFLRVRLEPSTSTEEIAQVKTGEMYDILEVDEETGWYKIKYSDEGEGWISNDYAEKVTETQSSPTPNPASESSN